MVAGKETDIASLENKNTEKYIIPQTNKDATNLINNKEPEQREKIKRQRNPPKWFSSDDWTT
jgi:hypothetical protein